MNKTELCKILDGMVEQFGRFEDYDRSVRFKAGDLKIYMESLNKENLISDIKNWKEKIVLHLLDRVDVSTEENSIDFESCLEYKTKKWWKVSFDNHLTKTYINIVDKSRGIKLLSKVI